MLPTKIYLLWSSLWICHLKMIKMFRKLERESPFTSATWWSSTLENGECVILFKKCLYKWHYDFRFRNLAQYYKSRYTDLDVNIDQQLEMYKVSIFRLITSRIDIRECREYWWGWGKNSSDCTDRFGANMTEHASEMELYIILATRKLWMLESDIFNHENHLKQSRFSFFLGQNKYSSTN